MTQNDVFTFTAPNGVEVLAVCLDIMNTSYEHGTWYTRYLCYGQNRLFTINEKRCTISVPVGTDEFGDDILEDQEEVITDYGSIIVEYCILPEYDAALRESELLNKWENETI